MLFARLNSLECTFIVKCFCHAIGRLNSRDLYACNFVKKDGRDKSRNSGLSFASNFYSDSRWTGMDGFFIIELGIDD